MSTNFTVSNKNGSFDGDMVVKQYTSMTVSAGTTVTTDQPCRGLMILVQGDCTINGTLSMTARGAYANPTNSGASDSNAVNSNGLRLPFLTSGGSSSLTAANTLFNGCGTAARGVLANFKTLSSNGTIVSLVRQGAAGGTEVGARTNGNNGSNGSTGQTGGGGGGGRGWNAGAGAGNYGSCFAGGSGGGGSNGNSAASQAGTAWGGPGGNAETDHSAACSGGAGNPRGNNDVTDGSATTSTNGVGGLLILIVGGNLTIGSGGSIECKGSGTGNCTSGNAWDASGGGSGGGNIVIAHRGTYTNNGSVSVAGGSSGSVGGSTYARVGGDGGTGSAQVIQVL